MTRLTIHRALAELKLIDSRIQKAISELIPQGIHQKAEGKIGVYTQGEFKETAKAKYQSVLDLINRKAKIKTAIVASNASTEVKIGERVMTVADAITAKDLNKSKQILIDHLRAQQRGTLSLLNKNNEVVDKNIQSLLEANLGKDSVKAGKEDIEAIRKPFMEASQWNLFDPLGLVEKIEGLEKDLLDFQTEVDAVLSESNAVTFIEI